VEPLEDSSIDYQIVEEPTEQIREEEEQVLEPQDSVTEETTNLDDKDEPPLEFIEIPEDSVDGKLEDDPKTSQSNLWSQGTHFISKHLPFTGGGTSNVEDFTEEQTANVDSHSDLETGAENQKSETSDEATPESQESLLKRALKEGNKLLKNTKGLFSKEKQEPKDSHTEES